MLRMIRQEQSILRDQLDSAAVDTDHCNLAHLRQARSHFARVQTRIHAPYVDRDIDDPADLNSSKDNRSKLRCTALPNRRAL
jgi:hypothetical protein